MSKKLLCLLVCSVLVASQSVFAFQARETARYFNGPSVTSIRSTSANVALSSDVLSGLTDEEKAGVYFEYWETNQVCAVMIYPTPDYCLPKKSEVGKVSTTITTLKPDTLYTISYKRDNTIRCITTPCPGNEFQSLAVEFKTTKAGLDEMTDGRDVQITKNLWFGSRGEQVTVLQTILIKYGYLHGKPTGYFGTMTFKAVKQFQSAHGIRPTGYVGALTRALLVKMMSDSPVSAEATERFEGTITAYSTSCFSDGECSVSVDGKKVVTTIGWSQEIVGSIIGVDSISDVGNRLGAHASVYAKKEKAGYTLYGSKEYYIKVQ